MEGRKEAEEEQAKKEAEEEQAKKEADEQGVGPVAERATKRMRPRVKGMKPRVWGVEGG